MSVVADAMRLSLLTSFGDERDIERNTDVFLFLVVYNWTILAEETTGRLLPHRK